MLDVNGRPLEGIRGRVGVAAESFSGRKIGLDLMEIAPGHGFPVHFHEGDHILYTLSGAGNVQIDDKTIWVREGDAMFIPAERSHRVTVPTDL
jgi:quercetin dioxygenase-like cupin family protein